METITITSDRDGHAVTRGAISENYTKIARKLFGDDGAKAYVTWWEPFACKNNKEREMVAARRSAAIRAADACDGYIDIGATTIVFVLSSGHTFQVNSSEWGEIGPVQIISDAKLD